MTCLISIVMKRNDRVPVCVGLNAGKESHMTDLEQIFSKTDFSKETNFREALRDKLFSGGEVKTLSLERELSDKELDFVNAAGTGPEKSGKDGANRFI